MLQKTSKCVLIQSICPLIRRYRVDHFYLHNNEFEGKCTLDHLVLRVKSIRGNVGVFIFTDGNFVEAYTKPIKYQHEAADSL